MIKCKIARKDRAEVYPAVPAGEAITSLRAPLFGLSVRKTVFKISQCYPRRGAGCALFWVLLRIIIFYNAGGTVHFPRGGGTRRYTSVQLYRFFYSIAAGGAIR